MKSNTRKLGAAHRVAITHFVSTTGATVAVSVKSAAGTVFGYMAGLLVGEPKQRRARATGATPAGRRARK